jgi:hypothetical protein
MEAPQSSGLQRVQPNSTACSSEGHCILAPRYLALIFHSKIKAKLRTCPPSASMTRTSFPCWPLLRSPSRKSMRTDLEGRTVTWPCTILCVCGVKGDVVSRTGRVVPIGTDEREAERSEVEADGSLD